MKLNRWIDFPQLIPQEDRKHIEWDWEEAVVFYQQVPYSTGLWPFV
jgi:hypothetical protein